MIFENVKNEANTWIFEIELVKLVKSFSHFCLFTAEIYLTDLHIIYRKEMHLE